LQVSTRDNLSLLPLNALVFSRLAPNIEWS